TDRVLSKEEEARLCFICVGGLANVAPKRGHVAEQKCCQTRSSYCLAPDHTLSLVSGESELASPMNVAGNSQIVGIAYVRTEFDGVVAVDFGPVVHKLVLMFALQKRAVALIRTERVSKIEVRQSARNVKVRHSGSVQSVYV